MIGLKKQRAAVAEQKAADAAAVPAPVLTEPAATAEEGKAESSATTTVPVTSIFGGVGGVNVRQQTPGTTTSGQRITPGEIRIQKGSVFCSVD